MLTTIAVVAAILIAALFGFAAIKPDTFRVERSRTIQASPERIYGLLQDFHQWNAWSPYDALDPVMKKTYSGALSGKGAVYEWDGNGKAGAGRMEIIDTFPSSRVRIKLDFSRPFEGHNAAEFTLEARGDATFVTWAVFGPEPYLMKVMTTFFNRDKLVGKDFETGLANIKSLVERQSEGVGAARASHA